MVDQCAVDVVAVTGGMAVGDIDMNPEEAGQCSAGLSADYQVPGV